MNEKRYETISSWFRENEKRYKIFMRVYRILPYIMVMGYVFCILYSIIAGSIEKIVRVMAVPAVTFLVCTVFRKWINANRPYENMNINPLIVKNKKGQSFPSRHTVSAAIIAMTALYINETFGMVMLLLAAVIGIIRPIAGVHYVKDVVAGFIIGVLFGITGFFIL